MLRFHQAEARRIKCYNYVHNSPCFPYNNHTARNMKKQQEEYNLYESYRNRPPHR